MQFSLRTLIIICLLTPPFLALVWRGFFAPSGGGVPWEAVVVVLIVYFILSELLGGPPGSIGMQDRDDSR